MASLYDSGWRQGSLLQSSLPVEVIVLAGGQVASGAVNHGRWVLATQDCDLDGTDPSAPDAVVELRPVYDHAPPSARGLRSRKLLLARGARDYLEADSPRAMISPAALTEIVRRDPAARTNPLTPEDRLKLKTWLGKRYDRPAVPRDAVDLGKAIASAVDARRADPMLARFRDILWQYQAGDPPRFSLFGILDEEEGAEAARAFLASVGLSVPQKLGVTDEIRVGTARQTSLHLIETSYSADVTNITWQKGTPEGAT